MKQFASFVRRQALPIFCSLTLALSFAATLLPIPAEAVPVVMVCIPALIALSLTATTDGWSGARALAGKLGQWRVRPIWLVGAVALGLVLRLSMSVIALVLGLIPTIQLRPWAPAQLAFFAVMLFVFALPEELGWRGYALPKLLKAHSPLVASLIVGVLWGSLHLALTMPGMINAGAPALPTLLGLIGLSVLTTWLYVRTNGNLLVTGLFHASQSFFVILNDGITIGQQTWLMAGVYLAGAVIITIAAGPSFARKPAQAIDAAPAAHGSANRSAGLLLDEFPYIRIGNGPQPLLIIPGAEVNNADPGLLTRQAMRAAFRRFARDHSVYIVHRKRGLPAPYSTAEMATDYARVLRAIAPSGELAHVIGFSTGGLIAQHLAAQSPELIDKLVLVVTGVRLSVEGRGLVEQWRALAEAQQWAKLTTAMSEVLVTGETSKRLLRGFMLLFGRLLVSPPQHPEDLIVTMNADLAHDTTALLPTLRMPTLVLAGDLDPFFPAPLLQETAELIPNALLTVYAGAGHGLTKAHKRRFEDDVLAFLTSAARPVAAHTA